MDEDTLLLIKKAQKGDGAALSKIVEADMPLVKFALSRRVYPGEYADLFQTGALGLIKAVLRFDPDKGAAFSTYAYSRISGELMNNKKRVPMPAAFSLDEPGSKDGACPAEKLFSDPEAFERIENEIFIEQIMSSLPSWERELIALRFFCGLTQKKTGERLGLSQSQVSRLERRIIGSIRRQAE